MVSQKIIDNTELSLWIKKTPYDEVSPFYRWGAAAPGVNEFLKVKSPSAGLSSEMGRWRKKEPAPKDIK